MAQLQHNMMVVGAKDAVLSIITGGGKWVEIAVAADPVYQTAMMYAERAFWRAVSSGEPPSLFHAEPPRARIAAVKVVDMSTSNAWAEFAGLFRSTRPAFLDHERVQGRTQGLMPEDAKEAIGHGIRAKRSKSGASVDLLLILAHSWRWPMPRSSESVAPWPRRLAKAQAELTNPEKSLVATLPAERGQPERSFRYAPLSGRPRHRPQNTGSARDCDHSVDRHRSGQRHHQLTTTLAHASGEWIASDWPVCALAELPAPHRMGAALTYARRYGLFTLVGIAGEDDLDAPELAVQPGMPYQGPSSTAPSGSSQNGKLARPFKTLSSAASAEQRDKLLHELASIGSIDQAAEWAKTTLPIKNTLVQEHACEVEAAFAKAIARFGGNLQPIEPA